MLIRELIFQLQQLNVNEDITISDSKGYLGDIVEFKKMLNSNIMVVDFHTDEED